MSHIIYSVKETACACYIFVSEMKLTGLLLPESSMKYSRQLAMTQE